MNRTTLITALLIVQASLVMAGDRVFTGWGKTVSASTTPALVTVEQAANSNSILNATFADATGWTTSGSAVGTFYITGGVAKFTCFDVCTQQLYYTFTSDSDPVPFKNYDVVLTVAGDLSATNKVRVITGADGTGSTSGWYTAAGTYTTRLAYATGTGLANTNFTLEGESTYGTATVTVDNVFFRLAPDKAWVGTLEASVLPTDVPVDIYLTGSSVDFGNAFAMGQTITVTSNDTPVTIDLNNTGRKIDQIYYRTATGTATLRLRGW